MRLRTITPLATLGLAVAAAAVAPARPGAPPKSAPDPKVAALLATCQGCHSGAQPAGGLDLTTRAKALAHRAVVGADPAASPLWKQVADGKMPPGNPLSAADVARVGAWIRAGSPWPARAPRPAATRADATWWSLQPLARVAPPPATPWSADPIDRFVFQELRRKGLSPAPDADRRTLIRRVTFDLTGLPPTPAETDAFLADNKLGAWERLVDRLLASPHYGERWGRHWLDVVRFGESDGYEYDRVRDNAWRYRDYVVDAFNRDTPYDRFLTEQIAGDTLPDAGSRGVVATGFLVCGPMDQAGKASAGLLVRQRAREEEMEDMIGLVGQTALGLTVNCARCHDHKFDPIPMADYYRLKAALVGVQPGNRLVATPEERRADDARRADLEARLADLRRALGAIEGPARTRLAAEGRGTRPAVAPGPAPAWRFSFEGGPGDDGGTLTGVLDGGARVAGGRLVLPGARATLKSSPLPVPLRAKTLETWVQLADLAQHGGSALTVQSVDGVRFDGVVFGERQRRKWMAGSDSFTRTRDLDAPVETIADRDLVQMVAVYQEDGAIRLYRDGVPYGAAYTPGPLQPFAAGTSQILFGNRHSGAADFLAGEIEEARVYDRALTPAEVAAAFADRPAAVAPGALERVLTPAQNAQRRALRDQIDQVAHQLKALAEHGAGNAVAYAAVSSPPGPTHVLKRGDPSTPAEEVRAAALGAVRALPADFALPADAPEGARRAALAAWIVHPRNPLTPRVLVNRVWQGHFGRGLVGTPNDFGFNGERPSHPALLDWLARDFVERGWSIKRLHRRILLSRTYRQSSRPNPAAARVDADNRLLWRVTPRRLEAEAIRDSLLAVGGNLNPAVGGPSFRPFTVSNYGSDFYTLVDRDTPEFNRRTLYRMAVHSARSPLLEALDCPDPSTKTPRRTVTTTPTQALEMMNDAFVLRQSRRFAARLLREEPRSRSRRVALAWRLAFGRTPTPGEMRRADAYLRDHSLDSLCWALFNANEFLHVN